jgi:hypothetical protein
MVRRRTIIGLAIIILGVALIGAGILAVHSCYSGAQPEPVPSTVTPELLTPADGESVINGSISDEPWIWQFRWRPVVGAEKYHLQVFGPQGEDPWIDKVVGEPLHEEANGSGWSIGESSLSGWTWKVRAQVRGQWSDWSRVHTFNVRKAATKPSISQEEYDERIKKEFVVLYLILRGEKPDQGVQSKVVSKLFEDIRAALDVEPPGGRLEMRGDGPFRFIQPLGLVNDVEAFGTKQKFGRVLAYDPDKRALVIDVGTLPGTRAEWKDAADLNRLVTAHTVRMGLSRSVEELGKEHPADQLVYLQFRGELAKELFTGFDKIGRTRERVKALLDGVEESRSVSRPSVDLYTEDVGLVVSPVKDFGALVRKIDFAEVLFSDAETRVLILGPLRKERK